MGVDVAGQREVADSERTKRWVGGGVCASVQYAMDRLDALEGGWVTERCLLDGEENSRCDSNHIVCSADV